MYPNLKECAAIIEKSGIALKSSNTSNVALHSHKWFELTYIVKGKTEFRTDTRSFIVSEGNYYVIDYDTPHEYHRINDEPFNIINIMFYPNFIDQSLVNCHRFEELIKHRPINTINNMTLLPCSNTVFNDADGQILAYINRMQAEYSDKRMGYREMLKGLLSLILIQITRNACITGTSVNTDNRSYVVADYIRIHLHERIKIEDAFPIRNYSLPYMSKKFKDDMGMTFTEYIKRVRIEESCHLLTMSDKTIAEISETVGYPDTTAFHRYFRSIMKISPHEYRKQYKKIPESAVEDMIKEKISKE